MLVEVLGAGTARGLQVHEIVHAGRNQIRFGFQFQSGVVIRPHDALFAGAFADEVVHVGTGVDDVLLHTLQQLHVFVGYDDVAHRLLLFPPFLVGLALERLPLVKAYDIAGVQQVGVERGAEPHRICLCMVAQQPVVSPFLRVLQERFQLALVERVHGEVLFVGRVDDFRLAHGRVTPLRLR